MGSRGSEILGDVAETLRACGEFAQVTVGQEGTGTAVPRASVVLEGAEEFTPDDAQNERWVRLRLRVSIRTRSQDAGAGAARANDLCASAAAALMADPHRGGLCQTLPIGRATEVGRFDLSGSLRRPEIEMSFGIRNHYVIGEGS